MEVRDEMVPDRIEKQLLAGIIPLISPSIQWKMAGSATSAAVISLSVPTPPSQKFPIMPKQLVYTNKYSTFSVSIGRAPISSPTPIHTPCSSSHSSPVAVEEEKTGSPPTGDNFPVQSESALDSDSLPSPRGCKACGREEIEMGCNGEGRIQGGIATVPGFGWWPIKAYRPCPAFVASGGRYRRTGQSMDEVTSGRRGRGAFKKTNDAAE